MKYIYPKSRRSVVKKGFQSLLLSTVVDEAHMNFMFIDSFFVIERKAVTRDSLYGFNTLRPFRVNKFSSEAI